MKTLRVPDRREDAFTLIELLIVIAIIAALAALVLSVMPAASGAGTKRVANAELLQVSTAIEAYKAKYGFYPPDATNVFRNTLYFELVGTILQNSNGQTGFRTLDGTHWITTNQVMAVFGISGFANSSTSGQGTDDRPAPSTFLKDLKPSQIATAPSYILMCSREWEGPGNSTNYWRYNSSHPTNNPGSYDLWVDLYINGKTQRVSNWSKQ